MSRWYKRCGADFIHGTMMLSLEEKGAYSLCLDLIYDRGGPIPDDARWLSGVCGVSIRKWNSIRDRLLQLNKIAAVNGHLSNARADLEIASAELQRRNQAESGAKGGRKRAENAATPIENKDIAQATLKPIEEIRGDKKAEEPRKRGSRLPSDFIVPDEWKEFARAERGWSAKDIGTECASFVDYWAPKAGANGTKLDWFATWRNWVRGSKRPDGDQRNVTPLSAEQRIASDERTASLYERMGRTEEAQALRASVAKRRSTGPPKQLSEAMPGLLREAQSRIQDGL